MEQGGPVTVVVRHRIRPGKEDAFEDWLRGITRDMLGFDGQQGFNVVRPAGSGNSEYLVFFRFDTFGHLETWEASETRRRWLERLAPLAVHPPTRERHTGLEVWFTPPAGGAQPPRWKMVAVTLLALYPLLLLVNLTLLPLLEGWPLPLRVLASSGLLVCLMTYGAMPMMTRLFARWLYGSPAEST